MKQIALDIGLAGGPTLANFLPGPNVAALLHVQSWVGERTAASPRSSMPTYLWGGAGSGKTHLLKAVREALREQGVAAGWLDADVIDPPPFDDRWVAVLMDDVQRYTATQQHVAFNWFVRATTNPGGDAQGSPIGVLAAGDVPPADLPLREDLRTRLGWGQVHGLQAPSETELRAVLRQGADARGVFLSDEVMDFMLRRFSRDLGSLMQLLEQLDGYALRTQRTLTIPLLKSMLEEE